MSTTSYTHYTIPCPDCGNGIEHSFYGWICTNSTCAYAAYDDSREEAQLMSMEHTLPKPPKLDPYRCDLPSDPKPAGPLDHAALGHIVIVQLPTPAVKGISRCSCGAVWR